MSAERSEILLVEHDDELAEMIIQHIEAATDARVRHARSLSQALSTGANPAPDLVISEMRLPDGDGLALAREFRRGRRDDTAVILMSDEPTLGRAIEAMRIGVRDLFTKPFDLGRLSHVVQQEMEVQQDRRRSARRHRRLRRLASRVIRDRRDLRRRVDLVCRDLVFAYHRLAKRVAEKTVDAHEE